MRNWVVWCAVFLSIILLNSCESEDQPFRSDSICPISTGNSWTYLQVRYVAQTNEVIYADTSTSTVGEKVEINGFACFKSTGERAFHASTLNGNDEFGNTVSCGGCSDVDTLFSKNIYYKKDAIVGETWIVPVYAISSNGTFSKFMENQVKCVVRDTLIRTPKGTFTCVGYEIVSGVRTSTRSFRYLSVGIGLVKSEDLGRNEVYISELIEYHLK